MNAVGSQAPRGKRAPGRPVDAALGPAIMLAVRDLLAESGYAALTTAAVARRAGVSTATLYRRWPTKRELVLASTRRMIEIGVTDEAVDSGAAAAEDFDTGSLQGDLQAFIAHKNRALSGATGQAVLSLLGELPQDPELKELLLGELLAATGSHLEQIRDRARARSEGAPDLDPHAGARLVLGAVLVGIAFATGDDGAEPLSDVEQNLLLRALGCG
ncbi:TetR/AcrR family transcriptional regulator [Actinomyces johnsonii]|uniref:TetR/AcrR family transcriptional regulator n=1 Tax=Actinomyces johnsonii TaxID=544581 RepID=A0A507ZZ91_9ACTO|nr:TetR/AcrR family transcriptional regulator [Actinomyces johnsonii]KAA8737335.1 TetR/AcrR family transcriptional regulator [Actinomyces johnsonii]TQD41901.1 TetR/AcrR family transcriptional regulator [Actinomyces johnsonii]